MERSSQKVLVMALVVVVAAILASSTNAQGPVCGIPINGLMACRPAVTQPPSAPNGACCGALKQSPNLNCLCGYRNSPLLRSMNIDYNLALALPSKCGLPRPRC